MKARAALAAAALALVPVGGSSQTVELRADVGASVRAFPEAPVFGSQVASRLSPSVLLVPQARIESEGGAWALVAEGFGRLDAHDAHRSHVDVRELGVSYLGDAFTAFVGAGQAFWGVTEVRHLVDVVNQTDAVEDLDGEDRLGQPMAALTLEGGWGALDLYWLPYFRERTFPDDDARLRGPLPIADRPVFTSGRGRWSSSFAARAFRTMGALDLGLSAFTGTSREPRFVPSLDAEGAPLLEARYDEVDQLGVDAQWTGERTLLKLEAVTRAGYGERLYAATAGVEHTLWQVFGSDGDLGLLAEAMFDSRGDDAPPTPFEHDVFVGGRWALNDVSDTSVLGGSTIDLTSGELFVLLEARRRVGSTWRLDVDARLFANTDPTSPVHGIRRDGFVSVSLTRYF